MPGHTRVSWVILAAAAAALGLPNPRPAAAGTVAPRDDTHGLASDGLSLVAAGAAAGDPLLGPPLDFDGPLSFTEPVAMGRRFDDLVLPQSRRIAFGLVGTDDTAEVSRFDAGEALPFQVTDAGALDDPSRFASLGTAAASHLSSDTGTAVIGQAGAEGGTPSQTRVARPLAIPLPPASALFPLGVAAALWARRWFRG